MDNFAQRLEQIRLNNLKDREQEITHISCHKCGKVIKYPYNYQGNDYGSECIKQIVNIDLSEIENFTYRSDGVNFKTNNGGYSVDKYIKYLEEQSKEKELTKLRQEIMYTILRNKDLSKIKSDYRKQVIPSVIEQYEKKGYMSDKQYEMVNSWLSSKENAMFIEMLQCKR